MWRGRKLEEPHRTRLRRRGAPALQQVVGLTKAAEHDHLLEALVSGGSLQLLLHASHGALALPVFDGGMVRTIRHALRARLLGMVEEHADGGLSLGDHAEEGF